MLLLVIPMVVIAPGETRVVQFFGRYIGTVRRTGLTWVVPLSTHRRVSVRVRNFETNTLKVNDADGNPVEIAAIVVWQVADTAKAVFAVDDYESFVAVQSESALRHVATTHPYDDSSGHGTSLRGSTDVVSDELAHEVAQRISVAGVEIIEVRISHLAYAAEIAQAMLQRQQAGAVVAARTLIVDGAVGHGRDGTGPAGARGASSSWTTSARRRWCPTCWSCCAATRRPRPSSTPAPSTPEPGARPASGTQARAARRAAPARSCRARGAHPVGGRRPAQR